MKTIYNAVIFLSLIFAVSGCEKYADDYKDYLNNKEIIYPGLARSFTYNTGNLRVQLVWQPSPDPSIVRYVIKWNNGVDSLVVTEVSHDPGQSMQVIIPNLQEYVYAFSLIAYDNEGHVSVGQVLNNVRVYGPAYRSTLLNRQYDQQNPYQFTSDGKLQLNFNKADTSNISTAIKYTNTSDEPSEVLLPAALSSVVIPDYKKGTSIQYRSSYKPLGETSIDEFYAMADDEFPEVISVVECNKALFKPVYLPGDIGSAWGWELPYIWDGKVEDNGFHTPDKDLPFWFTFDIGEQVSLTDLRVWQRMSALYNSGNPKRFEIWGSNNPASDGSWDSWTKLQEFITVKPSGQPTGQNSDLDRETAQAGDAYKFTEPTQNVRYIRFKVLETWGNVKYFHIVELSLYKKE